VAWAHRVYRAWLRAALVWAALAILWPALSYAQSGQRSLDLIDIHQGGDLSDLVHFLSFGGYELSGVDTDGPPPFQSFGDWYNTYWRDFSAEWLLTLDDNFGITFGLSTGERGEKYRIDPSIELGFITQAHPRPNATLTLTVATNYWGHLTEYPCSADYGQGFQTVNCRLAADPVDPAETLNYLLNEDPNRLSIRLTYSVDF
jgi:hypothetical protein